MHPTSVQFSSAAQSCPTLQFHGLQHTRLPYPSPIPRVFANSCPLSQWCHPTVSFCETSFPSCFSLSHYQGFSQWVGSLHQVTKVLELHSASASVLPVNIQGWFPLGFTSLISLLSKGLSRVFSNAIQKHQFSSTHSSLWSNSHIHTWLLEKTSFDFMDCCQQSDVSAF